jgi:two-component system sensor histidine kinase/response regulator
MVVGDPVRLRQILINLIGNAVKFTMKGEVSVHASSLGEDQRQMVLRFAVRDTGIGVSAEDRKGIFDPFSQADSSTTRKFGGIGLGLAIAKQLAQMMGGEVGLESEPGKGSTFWFRVLLKRQNDNREDEAPSQVRLPDVRVLIVDDNATNRGVLHGTGDLLGDAQWLC